MAIFCGGSGREAWHVLNSGASTVVVLDLGGHINTLPKLFQQKMKDVLLLRCNVSINALKQGRVDLALCDHALQHVENHRAAYANMAKCLKPGSIFSIFVYSHENNWPMTHAVEPVKLFPKSLTLPFIKALATIPAVLLYALDAVYRVLNFFSRELGKAAVQGTSGIVTKRRHRQVLGSML